MTEVAGALQERRVLVVLQNAWRHRARRGETEFSSGHDRERSEKVWRYALERSRSGQRLKQMIPVDVPWTAINASPFVGALSSDRFAYNARHVDAELRRVGPHAVALLCGREAQKAAAQCELIGMTVVLSPHPAWRTFSARAVLDIRRQVNDALGGTQ